MCGPRGALVVWSCGGNYELLTEYITAFEAREGGRVRYTAAPVQHLLKLATAAGPGPDVIVGRAGPGWLALKGRGRLAEGPVFFAIDPLGVAVARGNPLKIQSLADVGRPGVRVVQAPHAMAPKSKVPALLMATASEKLHPGLVERWQSNVVATPKCGRNLLAPIVLGQADCAVTPLSLVHYPEVKGKLDFVPARASLLLAMKEGRGAMPQCAAVLRGPQSQARPELAHRFVHGLRTCGRMLRRHGYLPLDDPYAVELKGMLRIHSPKGGARKRGAPARKRAEAAIDASGGNRAPGAAPRPPGAGSRQPGKEALE